MDQRPFYWMIAAIFLAGCNCVPKEALQSSWEPARFTRPAAEQGYQLRVEADRPTYPLQAPINLKIHLKNTAATPARITIENGYRTLDVQVFRSNPGSHLDDPVSFTAFGRNLADSLYAVTQRSNRTLHPGEEVTDSFPLSRWFDMTLPGTYRVIVRRLVTERSSQRGPVWISSNLATIEVGGPP